MDDRSKRIARNTIMLYFRTFLTMIIGFWTSRLMLEALGIDNYGIRNVVGSIVGFSGLLTGAMSAAGSRFITYSLGKGDVNELKDVFRSSFHVQLVLSVVLLIFMEVGGVWFLNKEANIPEGRMYAANFVLQTSIISLIVSLMAVPYNSLIIAHERMSLYAYMSIVDVGLQLCVVFCILHTSHDRLILQSILLLICSIGLTIFYAIYSRVSFDEARLNLSFNWTRIREICSFSGWNYLGNATWVFNTQGINMLVNIFFGVIYNAARGIAGTVNGCIQSFVGNFTMAFTPQITKSYASGDTEYCFSLVNRGARISAMLQFLFMVPVFLEANTLLKLWLVDVPPMSALFLRFSLVESFVLSLTGGLLKLIQANGKIRKVVIETSLFSCLVFPVSWVAYRLGMPVWTSYPIMIISYLIILCIYLKESSKLTSYEWKSFFRTVLKPSLIVAVLSFVPPILIYNLIKESTERFIIMVPVTVIWTALNIYMWGLDKTEKHHINTKISEYKSKLLYTVNK